MDKTIATGKHDKADSEIYSIYSHEADITFIMESTAKTISVIGFYFGEPDETATALFRGELTAYLS